MNGTRGPRLWLPVACVVALFLAAAGAAGAQDRGEYGPVPVRDSERPLMKTVTEYEDLFVRRGYRESETAASALVARIGAALAPAPSDDYIRYRFYVLRDPSVNAFALPDGQIYVHAGLLAALQSEAQLAAVLGHEVNHTAGHHGILSYRSVRSKGVAGMVFGPLTLGLSDVFLSLSIYGYSRELEEEADARGEARMLQAGWDPREMARAFEVMQADPDVQTPHRATAWSTHPQLPARAAAARDRAATLLDATPHGALRVNAAGYRDLVRPVACGVVLGLVEQDLPRSGCALARRLVAEAPDNPAAHFVLAEAIRGLGPMTETASADEATEAEKKRHVKERAKTTRSEREAALLATPEGVEQKRINLAAARAEYRKTLELDASIAEASRGLGYAAHALGDLEEAGRAFLAYLRARPEATDRPVVLRALHAVTEGLNEAKEARP